MTITIFDAIIILFIMLGAVSGFKRGVIKSVVNFVGTFASIIIAFYLKNPLSVFMYTYLPFFKFKGIFEGISVLNILIYELIAYLIVLSVLFAILKVILKVSGIIEKILDATIILGIPSKILGLIFGTIEAYLFVYVVLFAVNQIPNTTNLIADSNVGKTILEHTPILSGMMEETFGSINEIYEIADEYKNNDSKETNEKAFEILLKNNVLTPENAEKLVEKGKIDINNANEIIKKYQ